MSWQRREKRLRVNLNFVSPYSLRLIPDAGNCGFHLSRDKEHVDQPWHVFIPSGLFTVAIGRWMKRVGLTDHPIEICGSEQDIKRFRIMYHGRIPENMTLNDMVENESA